MVNHKLLHVKNPKKVKKSRKLSYMYLYCVRNTYYLTMKIQELLLSSYKTTTLVKSMSRSINKVFMYLLLHSDIRAVY